MFLSNVRDSTEVIEMGLKSHGCDGLLTFGTGVIMAIFPVITVICGLGWRCTEWWCGRYSRRCWRKSWSTVTCCSRYCSPSKCYSRSSLTGRSVTYATVSTSLMASSSFSGTFSTHQHALLYELNIICGIISASICLNVQDREYSRRSAPTRTVEPYTSVIVRSVAI